MIEADTKVALHNDAIPSVPSLNILCPWFQALSASLGSRLLEPFVIVPLCLDVSEIKVVANKSWYYHNGVASPLFANYNPSHPHMSIREGIHTEAMEVHKVHQPENKYAPSLILLNCYLQPRRTRRRIRP